MNMNLAIYRKLAVILNVIETPGTDPYGILEESVLNVRNILDGIDNGTMVDLPSECKFEWKKKEVLRKMGVDDSIFNVESMGELEELFIAELKGRVKFPIQWRNTAMPIQNKYTSIYQARNVTRLEEEIGALINENIQTEKNMLAENDNNHQQRTILRSKCNELEKRLRDVQEELDDLKNRDNDRNMEASNLVRKAHDELSNKSKRYEEDLDKMKGELSEKDKQIEHMFDDIKNEKKKYKKAEEVLVEKQKAIENNSNKYADTLTELDTARRDLTRVHSSLKQQRDLLEDLQNKHQLAIKEREDYTISLKFAEDSKTQLNESLAQMKEELRKSEESYLNLQSQMTVYTQAMDSKNSELTELRSVLEKIKAEYIQNENNNRELTVSLFGANQAPMSLAESVEFIKSQFTNQSAHVEGLQNDKDELIRQLNWYIEKQAESENNMTLLNEKIALLGTTENELRGLLSNFETYVVRLEEEKRSLVEKNNKNIEELERIRQNERNLPMVVNEQIEVEEYDSNSFNNQLKKRTVVKRSSSMVDSMDLGPNKQILRVDREKLNARDQRQYNSLMKYTKSKDPSSTPPKLSVQMSYIANVLSAYRARQEYVDLYLKVLAMAGLNTNIKLHLDNHAVTDLKTILEENIRKFKGNTQQMARIDDITTPPVNEKKIESSIKNFNNWKMHSALNLTNILHLDQESLMILTENIHLIDTAITQIERGGGDT